MTARLALHRHPRRQQGGLTLIELILFVVVVSVGITGILSVLNLAVLKSADPIMGKQVLAVAESMMEEILTKDYQNFSSDPNNSSSTDGCTPTTTPRCKTNTITDRGNYNDVDDYNDWSQTGIYQADGSLAPVLGTYTVTIAVAAAAVAPMSSVAAKQITVTVTGDGQSVTLVGYRTNY